MTNDGGNTAGTTAGLASQLTGANASEFAIDTTHTTCSTTLGAGKSCNVVIVFNPTTPGQRVATLTLSANPGSVLTIPLSGTASRRLGDTCSVGPDCPLGFCVDNRCCGASACGPCRACTGANGACTDKVTFADDPDSCVAPNRCDRSGTCVPRLVETSVGTQLLEISPGPGQDLSFTSVGDPRIGRITIAGSVTFTPTPASSIPNAIGQGPDGTVWFSESTSKLANITSTGSIAEVSLNGSLTIYSIVRANTNAIYFDEYDANRVGIVQNGMLFEYPLLTSGSHPVGVTQGPDGNLWFAEFSGNNIGHIQPNGTGLKEIPLPQANSSPEFIITDPSGRLWFTEFNGNRIGWTDTTEMIHETSSLPNPGSGPLCLVIGPDGNLWFTELSGNRLGQMSLSGTLLAEFPIPTTDSFPFSIVVGSDGNLWFTEQKGQKVARFVP